MWGRVGEHAPHDGVNRRGFPHERRAICNARNASSRPSSSRCSSVVVAVPDHVDADAGESDGQPVNHPRGGRLINLEGVFRRQRTHVQLQREGRVARGSRHDDRGRLERDIEPNGVDLTAAPPRVRTADLPVGGFGGCRLFSALVGFADAVDESRDEGSTLRHEPVEENHARGPQPGAHARARPVRLRPDVESLVRNLHQRSTRRGDIRDAVLEAGRVRRVRRRGSDCPPVRVIDR